eukprot:SAG11_NODE_16658_length_541_cov_0.843891_1_plen_99_part_10
MVGWPRPPAITSAIVPLARPTTYQLWWEQSLVQGHLPRSQSINKVLQLSQAKLAQRNGQADSTLDPTSLGLASHCMLVDADNESVEILVDGGAEGLAAG